MKFFSGKRRTWLAAALIVLALFLIRPGASRLKSRIILSISAGVGRSVDISAVRIRLLPRPGFELDNLVVYDDPAFGAEPILRASEVTADLRLTSLIGGRMEVSRLDLIEPSMNLVHSPEGRWNVETLLERAARIPVLKKKSQPESRPAFPYIEATSGRINLKSGPEKTPYALTNADFSLWKESDSSWGIRLKAQPFRSDMNLSDTGELQLSGVWQPAEVFRDTPLQFTLEWNRAQLGQFTKLIAGNDKGWRGEIRVAASLSGTPAKLRITSDASIDDFRRYDITSGTSLRLAARCDAEYSAVTHEFHQVMCSAPVAKGIITFTGEFGLPGSHHYAVIVTAEKIPANAALMLAQRAKQNLPEDLVAEGIIRGSVSMQEDISTGSKFQIEGHGEVADFELASQTDKAEIALPTIPFLVAGGAPPHPPKTHRWGDGSAMQVPEEPHFEFGPVTVRPGAETIRGWISPKGYSIEVGGEAEVARTLRLARMFGIPALPTNADGSALLDLQIAGSWAGHSSGSVGGFAGPQVTGMAKLRGVHVPLRGVANGFEILSAEMQLSHEGVRFGKLIAKAGGAIWTGALDTPRGCGKPDPCPMHFTLNANQIALGTLREWLHPRLREQPWYRVLAPAAQTRPLLFASLHASGRITTDRFQLPNLAATHLSANVNLNNGKLQISELDGDFFGGKHRGKWQIDFSNTPAVCNGTGDFSGVSLTRLADAISDAWIAGKADARYEVKGTCSADFWQSAVGTLQVDMKDGIFPRVLIPDTAEALQCTRLSGEGRLRDGEIEIRDTTLHTLNGTYELSGTASLAGEMDLKLQSLRENLPATGYTITGALNQPRVEPLSGAEQAQLKP